MPLSLHPLRERNTTPKHKNRFWKILKKFRNLLEIQKNDLPLHPLRIRNTVRNDKKKGSENFWKNLSKRFGGFKKMTYLCTTFRWKIAVRTMGKAERRNPAKRKKLFFIAIYLNSVLWSIWAAKSFPLSRESEFQTIPLRLELKI